MPRAEVSTLGLASLDRLRELGEATERRRAAEGRQVLDLAIDEVHPDPHQVRRDFAGDVVEAEDAEELEGLARSVASLGVQSPIRVRRDPEGGFVIVYGERRWRASRLAGLATVPCLLVADGDFDPKQRTLTQLAENLQRRDLRLVDVVRAVERCLEESGLTATQLAKELGRSKSWISKHLALGRATGALEEALAAGQVLDVETARLFGGLDAATQERLLRRARRDSLPISRAEVARRDRARSAEPGAALAEKPRPAGPAPATPSGDLPEETHVVRLTTLQLRELVARLGGDPDGGAPLVEVVIGLLGPARSSEGAAAPETIR